MSDFDFDDLAVKADNTAELPLPQLARHGQTPVLIVAPATEENAPFWNAAVRAEKARGRSRGSTPAEIHQRRSDDSGLLAKHVIRGWKGVVDKAGAMVGFSSEEALKWLLAVLRGAPDAWLEISAFCQDRNNFRTVIDTEVAAKNS